MSDVNEKMAFLETQNTQLRSSVRHLYEEKSKLNSKLLGVQMLTDELAKKNEECNILTSKLNQYDVLLSRAENRIAQLSQLVKHGKVPSRGAIITPGLSKKLLETLTRENAKLKLALEHVVNKQPGAIDLAVENKDLHDLILALKEELQQKQRETDELREALRAVETDDSMALKEQIAQLTAQLTQIERSLNAKQVYCEAVVSENEQLRSNLQAVKSGQIAHVATLEKVKNQHPAIKEVLELAWSGDSVDADNKDTENYKKEINLLNKTIEDLKQQQAVSLEQYTKQGEEMTQQMEQLSVTNAKLYVEIDKLKNEHKEVCMFKDLLEEQCKGFENDFKMERQEKQKLESDKRNLIQKYEQLQQECISVRKENEKIKTLIQDEFQRKHQKQVLPPTTTAHQWQTPVSTAAKQWQMPITTTAGYQPPHFNPMNMAEEVHADSPGQQRPYRNRDPTKSYLECPICKMILPPDQIEEHLDDCDGRK